MLKNSGIWDFPAILLFHWSSGYEDAPAELEILLDADEDLEMYSRQRRHSSAMDGGESRRASIASEISLEEDRGRSVRRHCFVFECTHWFGVDHKFRVSIGMSTKERKRCSVAGARGTWTIRVSESERWNYKPQLTSAGVFPHVAYDLLAERIT